MRPIFTYLMLPKAYEPSATEEKIYAQWEDAGVFRADASSDKEPFTVSMPPPNATGQLHLGHAVMLALEDIFIRTARMQGKEALWVPGTDHASIATESVVIREIQKTEGIPDPRAQLGREELIRRIADFVERSRGTIRSQVRKMGSSCDWSRERYTLEPALNRCVNEVFVRMYRDGLIYRGHRIVNWDPKMQTTVSDDEIERKEQKAPFYTFRYGPFEIGTARPETKFGDKYVVMHPDDERYARYKHGETFEAEWINGTVTATVIKDKAVDPSFGTGVMTITPWHDAVDFEIAERHDLEKQQIIDYHGKLLPVAQEFAGMSIEEARPLIVEKLKDKGLLAKVDEEYVHNVALSYRGGGVIEPQIKEQWFIDVNKNVVPWKGKTMSLKQIMQDVVRGGDIRIIPDRFEKVYFHWVDHLRDWCISRQIWWGHRVPVWYREGQGSADMHVGTQPPEGDGWAQDDDTLDTWFSSALWTWSTLIDPALTKDHGLSLKDLLEKSPDFRKFHPTSVMETGYDIIFFWVARMILMTTYATGQIPFKAVYLHGLVRTREGKKMSKSHPETMIDPLDIIPTYGADALRLSMIVGQSPGNDFRLYEEKIAGYRNFINKLWNASRFVLLECEKAGVRPEDILEDGRQKVEGRSQKAELSLADRALLSHTQILIDDVTEGLQAYRLSETGERLYAFTWDFFCDWYLELSKGEANIPLLVHALRTILTLLHPYCPFVTEELWSQLKHKDAPMLALQSWPQADASLRDPKAEEELQAVIEAIKALRRLRADHGIEPARKAEATIVSAAWGDVLRAQAGHIERLARLSSLTVQADAVDPGMERASAFLDGMEVHLHLAGLVDTEKERVSLLREKENLEAFLRGIDAKLSHASFVSKAPPMVVAQEREKQEGAREKLAKIEERLQALS